jgi:hypothetical protein
MHSREPANVTQGDARPPNRAGGQEGRYRRVRWDVEVARDVLAGTTASAAPNRPGPVQRRRGHDAGGSAQIDRLMERSAAIKQQDRLQALPSDRGLGHDAGAPLIFSAVHTPPPVRRDRQSGPNLLRQSCMRRVVHAHHL